MQFKPKFFFFIFLLFACSNAWAQVCNGSLGDPIVTEDFGSGSTPHFPTTTYTYAPGSCPSDGSYSLSKTVAGCHDDTWHRVLKDHTGNDGYMMVINASYDAGEFFKYTVDGGVLCGKTTYEFSAYILNLIKDGQSGFIRPEIIFSIETPEGVVLNSKKVEIPETSDPNGWVKYGVLFETLSGVTPVIIRMVNNAKGGNGNDFLLDDIAFRACGPDVKAGIANGTGDINIEPANQCVGTSKTYNIKSQLAYSPSPTLKYQWQQSIDGLIWADMPGKESPTLSPDFPANKPAGSYYYRLGVADGDNINSLKCRAFSNAVIINVNAYPDPPPLPSPRAVCEGDPLILTATGGASYRWTAPDMSVTSQNPFSISNVTAANAGHYKVEVISAANCSTFREVEVTINAKPVIDMGLVQPACKGVGVPLMASVTNAGPDTYTYSWFPTTGLSDANRADPTASPNNTTDYTVTVTNNRTGCSDSRHVQVDILDLPVAHAGADKKIFEGQSVKLDGDVAGDIQSYSWSPPDYLDNPNSLTPTATPPHDMNYLLTVTSANGCGISTDEVFVRVYQKITIPNTFTPNADGFNDLWNIDKLNTYPDCVVSVYTRNGKQVFQSRGYGKPWDGNLNGSPLPAGTYYYVIDLKNDTPRLAGWVLLVR
jgi:gliding motility-associated-like protein